MLTLLFKTITILIKGTEQIVYKMTLLFTKIYTLWTANKALSKHYRAKKACICKEDTLIIEDIQDFLL